jgi:uncharacterized protein (DUF1778 family)
MAVRTTRSEKLDLRLTRNAKRALQAAAAASHRSVSEFVMESALARADEALADRRSFGLNPTFAVEPSFGLNSGGSQR